MSTNVFGLVSIILPTYNSSSFIEQTIQSVLAQEYTHWELLIQDDCSTDDTPQLIERLAQTDERIYFKRNEHHLGVAQTCNAALERSSSSAKWMAFLGDRHLWQPNKLSKQLEFMILSNCDLAYHECTVINREGKDTGTVVSGPNQLHASHLYKGIVPDLTCLMYNKGVLPKRRFKEVEEGASLSFLNRLLHKAQTPCYLQKSSLACYRQLDSNEFKPLGFAAHHRLLHRAAKLNGFAAFFWCVVSMFSGRYLRKKS